MVLRLRQLQDRARSSLFFVPMALALAGLALGQAALAVDDRVDDVPVGLTATVESSRAVLGVIAGATISFAGIAFSVSLLLISLSSSQFSPRVVHGLFRDPFNKRVMGIVVGTFTYCLVVLRAVRAPLEQDGTPVVPSVSIALALLLGVVTILTIVAFIDHSAHSMDVSQILHRVTAQALGEIGDPADDEAASAATVDRPEPQRVDRERATSITFDRHGWIQQIDQAALLDALDPGSTFELGTIAGRYAISGTALGWVDPAPEDPDATRTALRAAIAVGATRTAQDDPTYGIRQLADVALKALSPGINDPTTAQDAMFHLGSVLRALLLQPASDLRVEGEDGQVLLLPEAYNHEDMIGLAFDEVRLAADGQPTVQIYLLELLHLLDAATRGRVPPATVAALRDQADRIIELVDRSNLLDADKERIHAAHRTRFPPRTLG